MSDTADFDYKAYHETQEYSYFEYKKYFEMIDESSMRSLPMQLFNLIDGIGACDRQFAIELFIDEAQRYFSRSLKRAIYRRMSDFSKKPVGLFNQLYEKGQHIACNPLRILSITSVKQYILQHNTVQQLEGSHKRVHYKGKTTTRTRKGDNKGSC